AELARFLLLEARDPLAALLGGPGSASLHAGFEDGHFNRGGTLPHASTQGCVTASCRHTQGFSGEIEVDDCDWPPRSDDAGMAKVVTTRLFSEESDATEPIAIIGIHGYYPQSADLNEYWDHLKHGRDLIDLVPPKRWDYEEFYDQDPAAAS